MERCELEILACNSMSLSPWKKPANYSRRRTNYLDRVFAAG